MGIKKTTTLMMGVALTIGLLAACDEDGAADKGYDPSDKVDGVEQVDKQDGVDNEVEDDFIGAKDSREGAFAKDIMEDDKVAEDWVRKIVEPKRYDEGDIFNYIDSDTGEYEQARLIFVDAPEMYDMELGDSQPFSVEAQGRLAILLDDADVVEIEYPANEEYMRDKNGDMQVYVWADGVNVNEFMIHNGYARKAYVYTPLAKYLEEIEKAEESAMSNKEKIWSIEGYVTDEGFDIEVTDEYKNLQEYNQSHK